MIDLFAAAWDATRPLFYHDPPVPDAPDWVQEALPDPPSYWPTWYAINRLTVLGAAPLPQSYDDDEDA